MDKGFQTPLGIAAEIDREEVPWVVMKGIEGRPDAWETAANVPDHSYIVGAAEAAVASIGNAMYPEGHSQNPAMNDFTREDANLMAGMSILFMYLMQTKSGTFRKKLAGVIGIAAMSFASEKVQNLDDLKAFINEKTEELKNGH